MARYPSLFTPGGLVSGWQGDPFLTLHREMNRLFDDIARGGLPGGGQQGQGGSVLAPQMDVTETDKELRIQAELPGVAEKDIDVSLNDDVLTIRAEKRQERKEEREGAHFSERSFGTFQRSLRLPSPVDAEKVRAQFENGVLKVTLPKAAAQDRTRRIQVQGGQPPSTSGQQPTGQAAQGGGQQPA